MRVCVPIFNICILLCLFVLSVHSLIRNLHYYVYYPRSVKANDDVYSDSTYLSRVCSYGLGYMYTIAMAVDSNVMVLNTKLK